MHGPESPNGRLPIIDGRIHLKREIARGAIGVVFEAHHAYLDRPVVVKLVRDDQSRDQLEVSKERLSREGRLLARLDHPNVPRVLDAGILTSDGRPYVVLEKLEGRSLDGLVAVRGSLGLQGTLALAPALASALDHMHRRGIVHGNVKPENVLVSSSAVETATLKLIGFGIASSKREGAAQDEPIGRPGQFLGSIDYIAPELIRHGAGPTAQSDQFSLAVLLFECLTGSPPSWTERDNVDALAAKIPEPLRKTLVRALQPSPTDRFASMADFSAELEAVKQELVPGAAPVATAKTPEESRRAHVRAPYVTPLRILRQDGSHLDGRTQDISEGGLLAILPTVLTAGERVEVRFALPTSGRMVRVAGVVRWAKDSRGRVAIGLGVELESIEGRADVSRYVDLMGSETTPSIPAPTRSSERVKKNVAPRSGAASAQTLPP